MVTVPLPYSRISTLRRSTASHLNPLMTNLAHLSAWDGNRYAVIAFFSVALTIMTVRLKSHIVSSFVVMNAGGDLGPYVSFFHSRHVKLMHLKGTPHTLVVKFSYLDGTFMDIMDITTMSSMMSFVHDLESFFWVLIHICITRQGPGGVRREELEQKNEE
jgi:hypothetical protein